MSLRRKMALRGQAKDARATEKRLAGLSRAGQVSRSSVVVGDGDVMVEDMLVGAVDTALTTEGLESDVGFLDEGVSADLGVTLDAGDSVGDVLIDVADSVPDLGAEFDYAADVDGSAHTARMEAIGANAAVTEAQEAAAQAAQDAADALTTASGKNSRRRGVTEPAPPEGGWVQGDQWVRDEDRDGVMVPVQVLVWDGAEFVPEQIIADDILVLGPDGVVRVANGKVTADALAVDALDFKTATGMNLTAGEIIGALIKTAASGQRLQMDSGGFKSFDLTGALAGTISPSPDGFTVAMPDGGTVEIVSGGDGASSGATVSANVGGVSAGATAVSDAGVEFSAVHARVGGTFAQLRNNGSQSSLESNVPLLITARTTNPGNSFALKSQLDAWTASDGTHAWVTSEGREYVRAGGAWRRLPIQATGTITISTSAAAGNTGSITFPAGLFPTAPLVMTSKQSGGGAKYVTYASSVTAAGANIGIYAGDGVAASQTVVVGWQAILD